ncbi:MAG: RecQ family zinc-binding domain-containing protein, partial [Psychroserpens sp.]|nr:RecQ family zinc-binding domain-containing protein [Psychroserpens sp.]
TNSDSELVFLQPREDDKTINPIAKIIQQQQAVKRDQVRSVIEYINNDQLCKSQQLLLYFGETPKEVCGICSVCESNQDDKHKWTVDDIKKAILVHLRVEALSSRQLTEALPYDSSEIIEALQELLEIEEIKITDSNTYTRT